MRNCNSSSFQRCGAAAWNARSPRVGSILPLGGSNKMPELDLILYEDLRLITKRLNWGEGDELINSLTDILQKWKCVPRFSSVISCRWKYNLRSSDWETLHHRNYILILYNSEIGSVRYIWRALRKECHPRGPSTISSLKDFVLMHNYDPKNIRSFKKYAHLKSFSK